MPSEAVRYFLLDTVGFVRAAAKEKAQQLLERESRLTLSQRDFAAFAAALDTAFSPNVALRNALTQARKKGSACLRTCRSIRPCTTGLVSIVVSPS